jgi:hypothetical protein
MGLKNPVMGYNPVTKENLALGLIIQLHRYCFLRIVCSVTLEVKLGFTTSV